MKQQIKAWCQDCWRRVVWNYNYEAWIVVNVSHDDVMKHQCPLSPTYYHRPVIDRPTRSGS